MNEVYFEVPITTEESRVFIPDKNGGLLVFHILFKKIELENECMVTIIGSNKEIKTDVQSNKGELGNTFKFKFEYEGINIRFEIIADIKTLDIRIVY